MKAMGRGLICGVVMMWLVCVVASLVVSGGQMENQEITQPTQMSAPKEDDYTVGVLQQDGVKQLELEDYLVGVLLGELPGDFHMEAKKALAVAARTFAVKMTGLGSKHGGALVCTDSACCQAYMSEDVFLAAGGDRNVVEQAKKAVKATEGMVAVYGGGLIDATYFSCSGGRTEDAVAVWGTDVPYLQAVDSPGEEDAQYYTDTKRFRADEFQRALGQSLTGQPAGWFGQTTYTDGGGVENMVIGGKDYSGTELRSLLGLRSASFTVMPLRDGVLITTRGYGHRVGLSQYGADAMGRQGADWRQILSHYYQGIEVVEMEKLGVAIREK